MTSVYADLPAEVVVTLDGPLRIVTFNRAEKRNALNGAMHAALAEIWPRLADDLEARCVMFQAEGDTFTAGGDFDWFKSQQRNPAERAAALRDGHRIFDGMLNCRLPIVTAIQGGAVGLGASLGILSDIVVMSEDAFYRDTHVALGMSAGDGGVAWPMSVGMQIAKEYVLLGDRLHAAEAYRLGMVNKVVPRDQLHRTSRDYAERLAKLPATAAQSTKRAFNLQYEQQLRSIAEYTLAWERLSLLDPEFIEKVESL
ncbi:enoyl-CoA hydratase/isomerase family protein [Nocardia abscessus]|uniref:enoyl-CoA hydratase/isomerase family protein n=1 Tax=Nocardia abscessus TaxID=120957 RepID=UPI0024547CB5|nr:enoyl-CoA hydratase-related protein [Nocardia abscessus]